MKQELSFYVSKKKLALGILGQIFFIAFFGYMASVNISNDRLVPIKISGMIYVVIFALSLPFTFKKMFDKTPELIISPKSIVIKSTGDEVSWRTIKSIQSSKSFRYGNTITLNYIEQCNERFIDLSATTLDINFNELVTIVKQYRKKYGSANRPFLSPSPSKRRILHDKKRNRSFQIRSKSAI
jgi:hypothetical protein